MAKFEEGVAYRIDRNGNVKRVEDTTASKKSRKKPTDDKSEQAASD